MASVVLRRDRVMIRGNPGRLRLDEIEYALRVLLWRMTIEDPQEHREWRRWAETHRPGPLVWGEGGPLTYTVREALEEVAGICA